MSICNSLKIGIDITGWHRSNEIIDDELTCGKKKLFPMSKPIYN